MFFHVLNVRKVIEGGPWTFEQSLLIFHLYDLPVGMMIMRTIGYYVGFFFG